MSVFDPFLPLATQLVVANMLPCTSYELSGCFCDRPAKAI